jgi:hypothetical protein
VLDGLGDVPSRRGRRLYYDLALGLAEQGMTISTIALGGMPIRLREPSLYGRGVQPQTRRPSLLNVLGEFETTT